MTAVRRLPLIALALATGGCAGAERETQSPPASRPAVSTVPSWLDGRYSDGTLEFRVPSWWKRSTSETWGQLLSDQRSHHPAFVSVRYLERSLPETREEFSRLAARTLRPPAGRGLTLLYTQTVHLGQRRGVEATFVWQSRSTTPIGPTIRTFGVELAADRSALLVFAAERPPLHAGVFAWVRKTIRWTDGPRRAAGRILPPHRPRSYGRFVNDA